MHCLRSREVRIIWKRWFFNVSGKDFNELTSYVFASKRNKPVFKVTDNSCTAMASTKLEKEIVTVTAIDCIKTESKIECITSAETTFIEDIDEKEILAIEEKQ